jgi:electron transfer flavoprotein beta subunit
MRILCVVKRVPDSRATIKVRPDGGGIETGGLKYVCDPFDEFGVAEAVLLKSQRGDVDEVVTMAAGGPETADTLRFCLAMGADRGVHLCDEAVDPRDELALAALLAAAAARAGEGFDLVLCGKQAIDNDAGELGPALAEHLDLPHIGGVTQLTVAEDGSGVQAARRIEGAEEIVEARLPVVVTCEKGLIEPKHPPLPKLMKAKKMPLETTTRADLVDPAAADSPKPSRLTPPPPRPACRVIDGEPPEMARELVRLLREEAKVL